jgi:uncharacterized membrane protein (DUF106 family)
MQTAWDSFVRWIAYPPGSMFLILAVSLGVTIMSIGLTRLLIDPKKLKEKQERVSEHQKEKKEIEKLKEINPKKYQKEMLKWERQDKAVQKMNQKMSLERLKPTCITFIPMLVMFWLIRNFYGNLPVAIPPMNANDVPYIGAMMAAAAETIGITFETGMINFTAWYFLTSFGMNTLIQKLLGMTPAGGAGGFGQLFDQSKYQKK